MQEKTPKSMPTLKPFPWLVRLRRKMSLSVNENCSVRKILFPRVKGRLYMTMLTFSSRSHLKVTISLQVHCMYTHQKPQMGGCIWLPSISVQEASKNILLVVHTSRHNCLCSTHLSCCDVATHVYISVWVTSVVLMQNELNVCTCNWV